jgi:hypothetical protein
MREKLLRQLVADEAVVRLGRRDNFMLLRFRDNYSDDDGRVHDDRNDRRCDDPTHHEVVVACVRARCRHERCVAGFDGRVAAMNEALCLLPPIFFFAVYKIQQINDVNKKESNRYSLSISRYRADTVVVFLSL